MASISGTSGDNNLQGGAERDFIYGREGNDTLDGGGGNDNLYGGEGTDVLIGGEGDDLLHGGTGGDMMTGGVGNDTYIVDDVDDEVIELGGEGLDSVASSISYQLTANVEVLRLTGTDNISGKGNGLDNSMLGNSGNNNMSGLGGNDSIFGYGGNDIINGGDGDDILNGGEGIDTLTYIGSSAGVTVSLAVTSAQNTGGAGIDRVAAFENLEGTAFDDVLSGNAGANQIAGLGGNDTIRGAGGDDDIRAGAGSDTIVFEAAAMNGVDRIRGFDVAADTLQFKASDGYAGATLTLGAVASGSGAQFIFNETGSPDKLYFDADGDGAGVAILIANFDNPTPITAANIIIV